MVLFGNRIGEEYEIFKKEIRQFEVQDKKIQVQNMFDAIAGKYDFLNHFLSAGIDVYWRKRALRYTGITADAALLDVACGTGDFSSEAYKLGVRKITGADLSFQMLDLFEKKFDWLRKRKVQAVAEHLPFAHGSFSNITVAFGVRNFYNLRDAFAEFFRVLGPRGKATILEFSMPKNLLLRKGYELYFRKILPWLGRIISGHSAAYTYLPDSVLQFDENVDLPLLLAEAGFRGVQKFSLTFGLVQVVIAEKE